MKLSETQFAVVDTETTGIDPAVDKVVEVALVPYQYQQAKSQVWSSLVNPQQKIPPWSSAVHHIVDSDVASAPTVEELRPQMKQVLQPIDCCLAYNSDFDEAMLKNTPFSQKPWLDVFRLALRLWSLKDTNEHGFPLKSFQQQELRYWLNLTLPTEASEAHRAGADVLVTAAIFDIGVKKYLDAGMPDDWQTFAAWVNSPIQYKVLPMGPYGTSGKAPEELEPWQLKKFFDPSNGMYERMKKLDVLSTVRSEWYRRFPGQPCPDEPGGGVTKSWSSNGHPKAAEEAKNPEPTLPQPQTENESGTKGFSPKIAATPAAAGAVTDGARRWRGRSPG